MLLLVPLASAASEPAPATASAQATVQVLRRVARASDADWKRADARQTREVLVKEKDGTTTRLRLIEYQ
jgi:hypothetical protein